MCVGFASFASRDTHEPCFSQDLKPGKAAFCRLFACLFRPPVGHRFGPCGVRKTGDKGRGHDAASRQYASCGDSGEIPESEAIMTSENRPLDPNRLTPEQAAKLLSAAAKIRVPVEQITEDLVAGAPQNSDGTINLMHYAAWMVKEMGRGD